MFVTLADCVFQRVVCTLQAQQQQSSELELLLCLIYKIAHGQLCLLISVSTTRFFMMLYFVHIQVTS